VPGRLLTKFFILDCAESQLETTLLCPLTLWPHTRYYPMMATNESTRNAWCNRPPHEKHLSLAEWVEGQRGDADATANHIQIANQHLELGKSVSARVRHEPGRMNGLEKKYAAHLDLRKTTGEILDWKFEPLKLKLAPATFYNPDFGVQVLDGRIELHETKGHWEDDARVKIKWAGKDFGSFFRIIGVSWDKGIRGWRFEEF
jgi:hypothetical protein